MLGDLFEFGYRLDHFCHVTLDYVFHSMSLSCFLPRAFVFLSWLAPPLHLVVTHLMLRGYVHDHLILALYTYHGPGTSLFVWSWIQFSTRRSYFHYRKVKGTFLHSHFFRESCLDHLIIFLFMELKSKVESRICGYRWSIDLMIVCFSHLFYLGLLTEILWSHL